MISATRSSIWPLVGRTTTSGSISPVGRTICSTTCFDTFSSYALGVADMKMTWLIFSPNSSNRSGRLSIADGSRKPCSTSVSLRDRSPSYWPWSCGTVTWLSSITHQEVVREVVEQRVRRLARGTPVQEARVVLDAGAEPDLAHHLEVVGGAHPQPLRLEQLVAVLEPLQPLEQLGLDALDRGAHLLFLGHVVRRREEHELVLLLEDLAGQRVHGRDALDLVAEQLDPDPPLLVRREDLDRVAADPELVADERHVVALVLQLDQPAQDRPLLPLLADLEGQQLLGVHLR